MYMGQNPPKFDDVISEQPLYTDGIDDTWQAGVLITDPWIAHVTVSIMSQTALCKICYLIQHSSVLYVLLM